MDKVKALFSDYTLFRDKNIGSYKPIEIIELCALKHPHAKWLYKKAKNEKEKSDILRLSFLIENPDYWYLDCDAHLEEIPPIENGKPYFAEYKNACDGFIIYGNNDPETFRAILGDIYEMTKKGRGLSITPYLTIKRQPNIIKKNYFKHKGV